jgi:tripartite-type tricarboxylate transporter receptor subunit TctC
MAQAQSSPQIMFTTSPNQILTIGSVDRGLPLAQLSMVEGVRYDMVKFSWIGSAAVESTVLAIRTDLPYKTFEDLRKAKDPIPLASMGVGTSDSQFPMLLKQYLKLNIKMINYPSSSEAMLAIERKEVDGRSGAYSSFKTYIDRGLIRPLIRGRVSEPGIEGLPVDEDLTSDPRGRTFMAIRSALGQIGRPYIAPPRTPPELMNILRDGFAKAAKDRSLQEESKKFMMPVDYVPADECLKVLNYIFSQPPDIIKELSEYVKF